MGSPATRVPRALCPSGAGSLTTSLALCPAQTCSRFHTTLPQGCLHLLPTGLGSGRASKDSAWKADRHRGPWNPQQGLCSTRSCWSGNQAWSLRRKRVRYQSSSFHIPRGPRTPLGESERGLGTQQLRTEAGKSLPLEPLRSARQPCAWPALGNFWLSGGTPGYSPRPCLCRSIQGLCI